MLRHEQQSIRMALATAMHHSFKVHTENGAPRSQTTATRAREGEVHEQHDGLRAQKRPLPATRPAPLAEVAGPQVRAATVGYVAAAGAPLLVVPSLGGGDAIDDTSVHFLLEMALLSPAEVEQLRRAEKRKLAREKEEKELEEKERQKAEVEKTIARLTAEFFRQHSQASSSAQRRKEKEEEEEISSRWPRSSSSTAAVCAGWFCWLRHSSCCVSVYCPCPWRFHRCSSWSW